MVVEAKTEILEAKMTKQESRAMRKSRGKRVDNGERVCGWYVFDRLQGSHYIFDDMAKGAWKFEVIPETVGQFTGKLDKNGKEIYNKTILLDALYKIGYLVCYGESQFGYGWFLQSTKDKTRTYRFDKSISRMEVIDDIHDGELKSKE